MICLLHFPSIATTLAQADHSKNFLIDLSAQANYSYRCPSSNAMEKWMQSLLRVCKYNSGKMKGAHAMVSIPSMKNEELVRMRMLNMSKRKPEIEDVRARNLKKLEKV